MMEFGIYLSLVMYLIIILSVYSAVRSFSRIAKAVESIAETLREERKA